MTGDRVALYAHVGAGRGWLGMLYIEPIYHRRLELQKAASGPEIGVAAAFGRSGCRCPLARIEDRHVKASPDARAAAMTSFVFPALRVSIGRCGLSNSGDSSAKKRHAARGSGMS
jgi:hypothetical protein